MTLPMDTAIPVPVHFDGHNINIISDTLPAPPQAQPKVPQTSPNNKDRQSLYKTELCREWSTSGWCYYGKRCSFAHGLNELRPVFRSKKWRTKRCRNWQSTGYCPYEHRCQFLHDQTPPRQLYEDGATDESSPSGAGVTGNPDEQPEAGATTGPVAVAANGTTTGGGTAGATTVSSGKIGINTSKPMDGPTVGDGGRQLYFHFEVRSADAEESEGSEESENLIGGERKASRRRSRNVTRGKTKVTVSKDGEEVLNEIGNNLLGGEGAGSSKTSPMNLSLVSGMAAKPMKRRKRRGKQGGGSGSSSPVVTQISAIKPGERTNPAMAAAASLAPRLLKNSSIGSSGSESPPPNHHPFASFAYPGQQVSQMEMMQAQQIMANQATANQLAAHLASVQLSSSATTGQGQQQPQGQQHQQPFFGVDAGAGGATTAAASLAAMQHQHQLMTALQRISSGGTTIGGEAGAPTSVLGPGGISLESMMGGGGAGAGGGVAGGTVSSPPPPSVPMDWAGLAGGLPSIPMSSGDANAALLNAMYSSMGPSLTELYYTARLNQMPTTDLEQLCMGLYPPTAPVPFASTPMTPIAPMTPGGGLTGMTDGGAKGGARTGGNGNRRGESGSGVFDRRGLHTPSGSVEPPGYDSAFYPTPSPPPSSFGGLDSVSNMHGVQFVPNDPSAAGALPNSAFDLAYAAAISNTQQTGPMTSQFYFPNCSTPVPMGSPPPLRPITPITPTGMYGGFPSFFGGPPVAQGVPNTSEMAGAPVIARPVHGLAGAATTATIATKNLSGGSTA